MANSQPPPRDVALDAVAEFLEAHAKMLDEMSKKNVKQSVGITHGAAAFRDAAAELRAASKRIRGEAFLLELEETDRVVDALKARRQQGARKRPLKRREQVPPQVVEFEIGPYHYSSSNDEVRIRTGKGAYEHAFSGELGAAIRELMEKFQEAQQENRSLQEKVTDLYLDRRWLP